MEDVAVTKRRDLKVTEVVCPEVFNQGPVGDDDDVFFPEPLSVVKHFSIVVEHQPFIGVGAWEGFVEATSVLANGNSQGAKAFLAGTVQDLEGGVRRYHADGDGLSVIRTQPAFHSGIGYAHMEWFCNRSMSIMSEFDVRHGLERSDALGATQCEETRCLR